MTAPTSTHFEFTFFCLAVDFLSILLGVNLTKTIMEVGQFKKCRDTLCFSTKVLPTYCFLFSLLTIVSPRRIWKQYFCTILTEKQRVLWYYLKQNMRNEFWRKFTYLIRENRSCADSAHTPCTRTPRMHTPCMPFTLARTIFFVDDVFLALTNTTKDLL